MNTRPYRTRPARPVTDAEYAALCQCACRRVPRRPHSAFECTPTQETGTGAAS
jgi:hypothetical protein